MTALLTRRALIGAAAGTPLLSLGSVLAATPAHVGAVLVHDDTLPAGQRFAARALALGLSSRSLEGDRVRRIRQWLLRARPARVFGMTRHADRLLIAEIAREMGYGELAAIQQRDGRKTVTHCDRALSALAEAAGPCWPEAFAELASGTTGERAVPAIDIRSEPGFAWVLEYRA